MTFDRTYWRKPPCECPACRQAGVSHLEMVRDGNTHEWLHGQELRKWYEAKNHATAAWKNFKTAKGLR